MQLAALDARLVDGPFTTAPAVRVSDGLAAAVTAAGTLTVYDVAPTVALTGGPSVAEGGSYTLTIGPVADPGSDVARAYTVNWGDGSSDTYTTVGAQTHTYADDGTYPITVDVTNEDGTFSNAGNAVTAAVTNVIPAVALTGGPGVAEGSAYTLTLGAVADPGADTVSLYRVNWGDGSSNTYTAGGAQTHTYADQGSYAVTVDLTDEDNTSPNRGNAVTATVSNVAPTAAITGGPASGAEGTAATVTGAFTDPGTGDGPFAYAWTVTAPAGTTIPGASGSLPAAGGVPSFTFTPPDDGTYTVSLTVTDKDGGPSAAATRTLTVGNVAPTVALAGGPAVNEGNTYTLTLGAATDPGTDTVSQYLVHWGDGSSDTYTTAGTPTHTYADDGSYSITVDVTDEDGTFTNAGNAVTATITNVAPTITTFTVPATGSEGSLVALSAVATDPAGVNDPLTYTWTVRRNGVPFAAGLRHHLRLHPARRRLLRRDAGGGGRRRRHRHPHGDRGGGGTSPPGSR